MGPHMTVDRNPRNPGGKCPQSLPSSGGSPQQSRQPRQNRPRRPAGLLSVFTPPRVGAQQFVEGEPPGYLLGGQVRSRQFFEAPARLAGCDPGQAGGGGHGDVRSPGSPVSRASSRPRSSRKAAATAASGWLGRAAARAAAMLRANGSRAQSMMSSAVASGSAATRSLPSRRLSRVRASAPVSTSTVSRWAPSAAARPVSSRGFHAGPVQQPGQRREQVGPSGEVRYVDLTNRLRQFAGWPASPDGIPYHAIVRGSFGGGSAAGRDLVTNVARLLDILEGRKAQA